jgi:hypothetical protein
MTGLTHAEDTEDYEKYNLEEMPITVVSDLKQYQIPSPEGIRRLEVGSESGIRN